MEEKILKEIMKERNLKEKYLTEVLINICKYYKIIDVKEMKSTIKKSKIDVYTSIFGLEILTTL